MAELALGMTAPWFPFLAVTKPWSPPTSAWRMSISKKLGIRPKAWDTAASPADSATSLPWEECRWPCSCRWPCRAACRRAGWMVFCAVCLRWRTSSMSVWRGATPPSPLPEFWLTSWCWARCRRAGRCCVPEPGRGQDFRHRRIGWLGRHARFAFRDEKLRPRDFVSTFTPALGSQSAAFFGEKGLASAMIDLSDGLSTDLGHICEESGVGAELESEAIPLAAITVAKQEQEVAVRFALHGGEDYELSVHGSSGEKNSIPYRRSCHKSDRLGHPRPGSVSRDSRGSNREFRPQGWEHFDEVASPSRRLLPGASRPPRRGRDVRTTAVPGYKKR